MNDVIKIIQSRVLANTIHKSSDIKACGNDVEDDVRNFFKIEFLIIIILVMVILLIMN